MDELKLSVIEDRIREVQRNLNQKLYETKRLRMQLIELRKAYSTELKKGE